MNADNDLEHLMSHIGDFGKYQFYQFLLISLGAISSGLHMITSVTVAAIPRHRCAIPDLEINGKELDWHSDIVQTRIPHTHDGLSSCELYNEYGNATFKCNRWIYDRTYYKSSRGMEWDMVCDRRWMGTASQMLFMLGVFTGAIVLGSLADKYGRKRIFCISGLGQLIMGTSVAFVPNYVTYVVFTYLYGIFGVAGTLVNSCVLVMELIGPTRRTIFGIGLQIDFAIGMSLVAFWGWLIKDRTWLQLVHGLHGLLLLGHWWLLDESPRWLWAKGRKEEAVAIIEGGMRINTPGAVLDKDRFFNTARKGNTEKQEEKVGILDLFKTPNLRKRTLISCYNWSAINLGYYGLSLGTNKMAGNPYLAIFIMAMIEIPSLLIVIFYMDRTGRRSMKILLLFLGSLSLFAAATLPKSSDFFTLCITCVTYLGKFGVGGAIAILYNYSVELYPTVLRNTGVGLNAMCGKLSASLTPLIALLDSYDARVPMMVFAVLLLISGLLSMLLPETLNQPMPQTVEDGENFRIGDTCCTTGCFPIGRKRKPAVRMDETGSK